MGKKAKKSSKMMMKGMPRMSKMEDMGMGEPEYPKKKFGSKKKVAKMKKY